MRLAPSDEHADRAIRETHGGMVLDYRGPDRWRADVEVEDPPVPARLVEPAEEILTQLPIDDPQRAAYLAGQTRAAQAVARRLDDGALPLAQSVRECLDVPAGPVDEDVIEQAHADLDAALPGPGPLAEPDDVPAAYLERRALVRPSEIDAVLRLHLPPGQQADHRRRPPY